MNVKLSRIPEEPALVSIRKKVEKGFESRHLEVVQRVGEEVMAQTMTATNVEDIVYARRGPVNCTERFTSDYLLMGMYIQLFYY